MNTKQVIENEYQVDLIEGMDFDHLIDSVAPDVDLFGIVAGSTGSGIFDHEPGSILNSVSEEEEEEGEDESTENDSGSTMPKKQKVDRSRTLVSERKRRGRMKDKLYALRALVPNITKMDKASIVGDAVLYVQQLQMQAKKLKAEVAELESSLKDPTIQRNVQPDYKKICIARVVAPAPKTITQMDVFQVEDREFYARLQSNREDGVAVFLYKAIESLSQLVVLSSNLTTVGERFILTFTITVADCHDGIIEVSNVKMWIARALVGQGFELTNLI